MTIYDERRAAIERALTHHLGADAWRRVDDPDRYLIPGTGSRKTEFTMKEAEAFAVGLAVKERQTTAHVTPRTDLYERCTWSRTERLERLAAGTEALTAADVATLWTVFVEGSDDAGVHPTLVDLGNWLAGNDPFETPADVVW